MLYDLGGHFSQRSITHALAGSNGGRFAISTHLQEHRLYGQLSPLGVGGVRAAIEALVVSEQVEEVAVPRPAGDMYPSWKLTPTGSALA
jgi:hypothetical protein